MPGDEDLAIVPEARIECGHQSSPVNSWCGERLVQYVCALSTSPISAWGLHQRSRSAVHGNRNVTGDRQQSGMTGRIGSDAKVGIDLQRVDTHFRAVGSEFVKADETVS